MPGGAGRQVAARAVEPTQPLVAAMPEPPASSAHENVSGTGWPCVYTAPSAMFVVIVGATVSIRNVFVCTADVLPLMSVAIHLTVFVPGVVSVSTSPMLRARWALYVGDDRVGVEPSVV